MRGCNKKKKAKYIVIVFFAIIILGRIFIPWALEPENFRDTKNKINSFINRYTIPDSYNAKSLIAVDLSNNNDFVSKRANEQQTPASLAKLFVIDYATTLVDLDDVVLAKNEAISLTKQGSSVANIKEKKYYVKNLFAAMLVPSGNDAAYVLADYCGGIISPKATTSKERIEVFMKNLNEYLKQNDYKDTILYDPSGFDTEAHTTVLDLKEVVMDLLKNEWFKDIVSQTSYTATLPDGSMQTWKNTNTFLDPTSEYYNKNVIGVKTGSLSDDFNLVVLYKKHGKEIADLIEIYLKNENYNVYKYYSSEHIMNDLENIKIDLAILDIMMPGVDGFSLCEEIRKKYNFPIIFVTAKVENIDKISGFAIGADDYVTKPFEPLELVARVKAQIRRYKNYNKVEENEEVIDFRNIVINNNSHEFYFKDKKILLTPIEFSIMWYLCKNRGTTVKTEDLFMEVWKEKYYEKDNNTIMVHIRHLREKMNDIGREPKYIKTIWGVGYKIENGN